MNKKFYCLALGAFLGGIFVSCTNDLNEPTFDSFGDAIRLVKAPEVYAWSGDQTFGNNFSSHTRAGEVVREYYEVIPDYSEWCNELWPSGVSKTSPVIPNNAEEITLSNYWMYDIDEETGESQIQWKEGGTYVLRGDVLEENYGTVGVNLKNVPNNITFYVDGAWHFFDSFEGEGLKIYVCKNGDNSSWAEFDSLEGEPIYLKNVEIFNYGTTYIYDTEESINDGAVIYNIGKFVVEQNYVGDNGNLSLNPLIITQPIYSLGIESEFYFKGGVNINTSEAYFRKVCVDGQMTVEDGKTVHTGYLNADELYGHDRSKVEMAPEGMIVAGTVSMKATASIKGVEGSNGFLLTNEIIGINKTNGTPGSKMESQVNADNFSTIFQNLDIYVTKTINNSQDLDTIKGYKAKNGITYPLDAETEFDASENDDVRNGDVNGFECGVGYRYVHKSIPEETKCDQCGHASHDPGDCDVCNKEKTGGCYESDKEVVDPDPTPDPDPIIPGTTLTDIPEHVEVNLSIEEREDVEWLASHLSIHVRAATDVEVFIPLPAKYYCDADDMAIVQKHLGDILVHGGPEKIQYNIDGNNVTLTLNFEEDGIRVTTDGINQNVIDYLNEKYGDGITFEVWNYMNLRVRDWESGNDILGFGQENQITAEALRGYLNKSTVKFLDKIPDLYVNAFMYQPGCDEETHTCGKFVDDCTVTPVNLRDFEGPEPGLFYNDSPYNQLYWKKGYTPGNNQKE